MNNLYENIVSSETEINYQDLYGRDDKRGNPELIFNTRFNEGLQILRMPVQTILENNVNYKDYDTNKNFYNRYQNNILNESPMKNDISSGVGNFATFKSNPNSNDFINSLTNNSQQQCKCNNCSQNQQQHNQQQLQQQQLQQQQLQQQQLQQQYQQQQYQQQQNQQQLQQQYQQQQNQQHLRQQQIQYQQQSNKCNCSNCL